MTVVKICDIRDPVTASFCSTIGVEVIGLHAIWKLREDLEAHQTVIEAAHGCRVALVTRSADPSVVTSMAERLQVHMIQLHSWWDPPALRDLHARLRMRRVKVEIIGVVPVGPEGVALVSTIEPLVDYILLDSSAVGGSGVMADPKYLSQAVHGVVRVPYIIAGGLRPENVGSVIDTYKPWGVDVQSGVEYPDGTRRKDPLRIQDFVSAVKRHDAQPEDCDANRNR